MNDPRFESKGLYDIYRVGIRIRDKLCGGVPRNRELLEDAVRAHTGHDDEHTKKQIEELGAGIVDEIVEKSWNGFPCDESEGLFLPTFQVKAMFKELASLTRLTVEKRGAKQIIQHGTFIVKAIGGGDRIYLGKKEPDGYVEGPVHVMTPLGPRTALKRLDYVEKVDILFDVWVYATHPSETRHVGENDVVELLRLGQENGLGADRSQGKGTFDVISFECVQRVPRKAEPVKANAKATVSQKTAVPAKAVAS